MQKGDSCLGIEEGNTWNPGHGLRKFPLSRDYYSYKKSSENPIVLTLGNINY